MRCKTIQSLTISNGTVSFFRSWTSMDFFLSGHVIIDLVVYTLLFVLIRI